MHELILIPTARELEGFQPHFNKSVSLSRWAIQICGFGPIAAAARTAALVTRYKPNRVMLLGIAGSYATDAYPVGSAVRFEQVACEGVGVGAGDAFQSADQLGWKQFDSSDAAPTVGDRIRLTSTFLPDIPCAELLLTCCAASANAADAEHRLARYPGAVAEDMEGYGVALACSLARVPLQIIRGISNQAGDRDHDNWQIHSAIQQAVELAEQVAQWEWIPGEP